MCLCLFFCAGHAAEPGSASAGAVAKISLPWADSLVRADVPVFGVADAPDLKQWRLEFGEGTRPVKWELINAATTPQCVDPWAAGKVKWDPNAGARGNLGVWHTGLSSYHYPGRTENLNGVFTLRLTVEDRSGRTATAQVAVTVARSITRVHGGIVESHDKRAYMNAEAHSIQTPFLLASLVPVSEVNPPVIKLAAPQGLVPIGATYECRPPGTKFLRPVTLRLLYAEEDLRRAEGGQLPLDKLGIYAYEPAAQVWRRLPGCHTSTAEHEVATQIDEITRYVAFYALMADVDAPAPPRPEAASARVTEEAAVTVAGVAEPFAKVEVMRGGAVLATAQANLEKAACAGTVREVVADKGYHKAAVLERVAERSTRTYIPERQSRRRRHWKGKPPPGRKACYANRRRTKGTRGRSLQRRRNEKVERSFAHTCETGGGRRATLRGLEPNRKRHKILAGAHNLGRIMREEFGVGKPRALQGRLGALWKLILSLLLWILGPKSAPPRRTAPVA